MVKPKNVAIASKSSNAPTNVQDEPLYNTENSSSSASEKSEIPSPLEFDTFIPWVCKQWCGSTIVLITPKSQEQFNLKSGQDRKGKLKTKSIALDALSDIASTYDDFRLSSLTSDDIVPITAYYDAKHQLAEIAIVGCQTAVSRKIIQAFSLAVPYHTKLTRFIFRRSGLTAELIYEIKKLLVISNICEICFDDSYVREGNYYILLEQFSQLKYLSLNRCRINDVTCMKIFDNINVESPAANTLRILQLGSNDITDVGAKGIGSVLRTNRCLLHLNLSGNKITDTGFIKILDSLMEFPLDSKEGISMRRRKIRYIQSKMTVYSRCLNDLKCGYSEEGYGGSTYNTYARGLMLKRTRLAKKHLEIDLRELEEDAAIMTMEIIGEFNDPFSPYDVEIKDGAIYSKGNNVLCSLNVAYNDLHYPSVRKLNEVLRYQHSMFKSCKHTGLFRVTLDGNNIPITCPELDNIGLCFKNIISIKSNLGPRKKTLGPKNN